MCEVKVCKECKRELPKNTDYYFKKKDTKDGLTNKCKECMKSKNFENFNINDWYNSRTNKFKNNWKLNDIIWLYENYLLLEKKDILNYFNNEINYKTITNIIYQWGIKKIDKNDDWSKDDIQFLIDNYPNMEQSQLQERFNNRTWHAIKTKASKLSINRDEETYSMINSKAHIGLTLPEEQKRKISLAMKGEKNWNWKGGISPIVSRLREYTLPWKMDSLKQFNYLCALSAINDGTLEIHHLYKSFSEIVYETFEALKLPINNDMSKYTEEERDLIKDKLLELHYYYGLGIPLTKKIHDKFHKIYGTKNNTTKQFYIFIDRYNNGEFDNLLEEVI